MTLSFSGINWRAIRNQLGKEKSSAAREQRPARSERVHRPLACADNRNLRRFLRDLRGSVIYLRLAKSDSQGRSMSRGLERGRNRRNLSAGCT